MEPQNTGDGFGRSGRFLVAEHNEEALIGRIDLGGKGAFLFPRRSAQGKQRFAFPAETLRKLRGCGKIVRRPARAQIDHDRVDFLSRIFLQRCVERLEIDGRERAAAQVADVAFENLAVKWIGPFRDMTRRPGQQHDAAAQTSQHAREHGAIQLSLVERGWVDVIVFQELDHLLQIGRAHAVDDRRRRRRGGRRWRHCR